MQRKKVRGSFSSTTVEIGNALLPSMKIRRMNTKRLAKYLVLIVIGYIVYSVYRKNQIASESTESPIINDDDALWNNIVHGDKENIRHKKEDKVTLGVERRVKAEINKVFQEFKQKQEDKAAKSGKEDEDELFLVDKETDDEIFGDKKGGLNENIDDTENDVKGQDEVVDNEKDDENLEEVFEKPNKEEEKKDLEIEKEIEERLAHIMDDAKVNVPENMPTQKKVEIGENIKEVTQKKVKSKQDEIFEKALIEADEREKREKNEFNAAVQEMGKKLHPLEIKRMNEKNARRKKIHDDDHEFPPFVTAVRQTTMKQVLQLVASIQQHFAGRKMYVYDLDLNNDQKKELMAICGVRLRLFMKNLFPHFVSDLDNLHWKPLIMQTALAEFGHITWVNPQFRLGTQELAPLVHESHETGVLLIGQSASYTTYSATHPSMLKFIPANKEKLSNTPHIEIRAIMIHNTPEVHDNLMKVFTACALEESCLAPKGAKWQCKFDFTGRKPADCHRFDESAINILLKNWFDYDMAKFARRNNYFRPYDVTYMPKIKYCRDVKDIRDSEL